MDRTPSCVGILLMAYGTPGTLEPSAVQAYYTHIRHGHQPTPGELADLMSRYQAIGGPSPLLAITRQQAEGLQAEMDRRHGPGAFRVYLGMKHVKPFIADGIQAMRTDGVEDVIGLVLAPHFSSMSVGAYLDEVKRAINRLGGGMRLRSVRQYHLEPELLDLWAARIREGQQKFSPRERENLPVIFSAHSLPQRILAEGDPYPEQLRESGERVAQVSETRDYTFCWQSAGRTREPWLGPDILEKLTMMREAGYRQALVCPIGFVADHLEILYDLDIQAQAHAKALGIHLERTRSLNADPGFLRVLANVVDQASDVSPQ